MSWSILMNTTVARIRQLESWGLALITGLLILRAINDFMEAYSDPETGLKEALRKSKKRVYAALIAITVESLVVYIQHFYS